VEKFKIQGFIDFVENTKPSAMLIKDVLEERNITLVHANSGTSKTSAWCYDLAAAVLSDTPFLGKFDILAKNVYVFFVSQDAPAHDVVRHAQKVFRRYFNLKDPAVQKMLNERFNVLDYQGIKLGKSSIAAEKVVDSIRARLKEVQLPVPGFTDVSAEEVERAALKAAEAKLVTVPVDEDDDVLSAVQPDEQPIHEVKVLLIWDSLRKLHDGKESASDELTPVLDGLRHVNRELDATSIVFHHNNRGGTIRGDASIEDAVDQRYHIKRVNSQATDDVQFFNLFVGKPRAVALQPFRYRLVREHMSQGTETIRFEYVRPLEPDETEDRKSSSASRTARSAPSGAAAAPPADPVMSNARAVWAPGMSQNTLSKALRQRGVSFSNVRLKTIMGDLAAQGQVGAVPLN
jgi:hypothetical protein